MRKKWRFAYCSNCEKEIVNPKRKSFDSMYYNIWILVIIASLGFGIIAFLVYHYVITKKNLCPNCQNQLEFYSSREEIPEPKAEITRILQTIEREKQLRTNKVNCPFCQEEISSQEPICPKCGTSLKE
ncbi:MAG: hypothetical protein HWN81_20910 [Candidatus Lokiarchaeota archaeon]|nr:hypothetical protein [Candidatus Lokiarchaeota archaeon]